MANARPAKGAASHEVRGTGNAAQARSIASAGRSGIGVKVGIRIPKPRSARRIRMCSAVKIAAVATAAPGPSARVVATKIAGNKSARRNG